jgi:hypothetical protein
MVGALCELWKGGWEMAVVPSQRGVVGRTDEYGSVEEGKYLTKHLWRDRLEKRKQRIWLLSSQEWL